MARVGNSLLSLSCLATANVVANTFVGFNDVQASVAGQAVKGVAEYPAIAGDNFSVTSKGTAFVIAGGVVNVGDPVASDANGYAVTAAALTVAAGATAMTSSAANGAVLAGGVPPVILAGRALQAATAEGQLIEILLS